MSNRNNILKLLFCTMFALLTSCSSVHNTTSNRYYKEIMNSKGSEDIDLTRRQAILNFVENFRTAHNRKDIDLLARVYADDALIIIGEKTVQNKMEYIKYLRSVFEKSSRINVVFDSVKVVQHPQYNGLYGVELLQGWNTTHHSDVGSLFLMIDFGDGKNMRIHVRSWQSDDLNGNPLSEDEKFKLGDFDVRDK